MTESWNHERKCLLVTGSSGVCRNVTSLHLKTKEIISNNLTLIDVWKCSTWHSNSRIQYFSYTEHNMVTCAKHPNTEMTSNSISFSEIASQMFHFLLERNWKSAASITLSLHKRGMSLITSALTHCDDISLRGIVFWPLCTTYLAIMLHKVKK